MAHALFAALLVLVDCRSQEVKLTLILAGSSGQEPRDQHSQVGEGHLHTCTMFTHLPPY